MSQANGESTISLTPVYESGLSYIEMPALWYQPVIYCSNQNTNNEAYYYIDKSGKKIEGAGWRFDDGDKAPCYVIPSSIWEEWNNNGDNSYDYQGEGYDPRGREFDGEGTMLPVLRAVFEKYAALRTAQLVPASVATYQINNPGNLNLSGTTFSFKTTTSIVVEPIETRNSGFLSSMADNFVSPIRTNGNDHAIEGGLLKVPFKPRHWLNYVEDLAYYLSAVDDNTLKDSVNYISLQIAKEGEPTITSGEAPVIPAFLFINGIIDNAPENPILECLTYDQENCPIIGNENAGIMYKYAAQAINKAYTHSIPYNESLNILPFIETHIAYIGKKSNWKEQHQVMDAETFKRLGLRYVFSIIADGYNDVSMSVSQDYSSDFGYRSVTISPNSNEAIGHEPLIKVEIVDSSNNVLYVGYIKLLITDAVQTSEGVVLNSTSFPDATFRAYISDLTGVAESGMLTEENLLSVTSIDVHYKGIASLQGIEHFTSLTELICYGNELTSLDVSNNTALTYLDCGDNQLSILDVTNNTSLNSLLCGYNQLMNLDVSNNIELTWLECNNNSQLSCVDLSNNTTLTRLLCSYSQLSCLDVSNNPVLTSLGCYDNIVATSTGSNLYSIPVLSGFDLSKVTAFKVNNNDATLTVVNGRLIFRTSVLPRNITYKYNVDNSTVGKMDVNITITSIEVPNYDNTIYMDDMEVLSGTEAMLSVKMKNEVVAEGFEFDMYLPDGITVVQDEDGFPEVTLSTERTTSRKTNSFDAIFNADGSLRVLAASTNGSTISGNDGEVVQVKVAIADDLTEGDYTVCFKNIAISDENAVSYTSSMTTSTIKVNTYIVGDANTDKKVDVADFTAVAHHLLNNTPQSFHMKAADANTDNRIDVGDLTAIAHLILYGTITKPTNTSGAKPFMMMDNGTPADENYIYIEPVSVQGQSEVTLSVKMRNAVEAEGFEFDLYLPDGMSFVTDADGFAEVSLSTERTNSRKTNSFDSVIQEDGSLRVLAASTNGSSISGNDGEVALVTIHIDPNLAAAEYPLLLKNIAIADVNAVSHSTDLKESTITILYNGIITGIDGVDEMDDNADWYMLDGKKLNSKPKARGVYIMNGQKVVIK